MVSEARMSLYNLGMSPFNIVMTFDVEPYDREIAVDRCDDWLSFEQLVARIEEARPGLAAATGRPARFSWFFRIDPQIERVYGDAAWAVRRYESLIRTLESRGDDIGLHVHAWRWNDEKSRWIGEYDDPDWVDHCLELGFAGFRRVLGRTNRVYRMGDAWLSERAVRKIRSLGARVDATIEPGKPASPMAGWANGVWPDHIDAPRRPYWRSRADYRKPGIRFFGGGLRMMPVSTVDLARWPNVPYVKLAAPPAGRFEGHVDLLEDSQVQGWVYDVDRPDHPLPVEIEIDGQRVLSTIADIDRPDVRSAGKGNGWHGFRVGIPAVFRDGRPHRLRVVIAGTEHDLSGSPTSFDWPAEMPPRFEAVDSMHHWDWIEAAFRQIYADASAPYLMLVGRSGIAGALNRGRCIDATLEGFRTHPLIHELTFDTVSHLAFL